MAKKPKRDWLFIYDTAGDWFATKIGDNIFDTRGEWVGFVEGSEVWTAAGEWIGKLHKDGRILRKRAAPHHPLRKDVPPRPPKPDDLPARAPLPPMMASMTYDIIDVLEEEPDIFQRVSETRPDMD
ncbi:MAG: hypothetical protein M5R40_02145 [Anaerolineae bacterium]|nr:hypothetical protein [Anaerolineae bacterium]